MKKPILNASVICIILGLFLNTISLTAQAPTAADRKAAEIKRLETAVQTAEAKVALNEKKLATADSLIKAGNAAIAETRTEDKAIASDKKRVEKEYNAARKPVLKRTTSKDKADATAAKAELKTLDTQYKADIKELDTRYKESTKKFNAANAAINKGNTMKKTSKDALNMSEASLKAARQKYEAATAPAGEEKKKK